MPIPALVYSRRLAIVLGLAAATACGSERGSGGATDSVAVVTGRAAADSAAPVAARPADSVTTPAPARDSVAPTRPAGPVGLYAGAAGAGEEVMITLQANGQYLMLIRKPAGGMMSQGRYRVVGDSLYMVPAQSVGDAGLMVAVLRGDELTVNPSKAPTVLMRRRGAEVGSGVAPPPSPR